MSTAYRPTKANKMDAGNGSYGICRDIDSSRSPSPDPKRSAHRMLLYLIAVAFPIAIIFASIPTSANAGNKTHILNGREPNAGVSIFPGVILLPGLWCAAVWLLVHFFDRSVAWITLVGTSSLLLFIAIYQARRSTLDYQRFS